MNTSKFNLLHQQATPLLLCNVWDVASAKAAEKLGYQAIGTSSAAIANMLGYEDGEEMSFEELLFIVKRIVSCSSLPLTVDIEAGYSEDPLVTASYIKSLASAGVVGINIEDSKVEKERFLVNERDFAAFLSAIKLELAKEQVNIFINVRIDTFLLGVEGALIETNKRAKLFKAAGADGLFVPCITNVADIDAVVTAIDLPINVMCMPDLPNFTSLTKLGVKRISMGNFLFDKLHADFEELLLKIQQTDSFEVVF